MKTVIFAAILTMGLFSNASELDCSAKIIDHNTGNSLVQAIEITATNAVTFEAEAGDILVGDLKLSVYRNLSGNMTFLSISKKNDSTITPFLDLSSSSTYKAEVGQELSLSSTIGSQHLKIECLVK